MSDTQRGYCTRTGRQKAHRPDRSSDSRTQDRLSARSIARMTEPALARRPSIGHPSAIRTEYPCLAELTPLSARCFGDRRQTVRRLSWRHALPRQASHGNYQPEVVFVPRSIRPQLRHGTAANGTTSETMSRAKARLATCGDLSGGDEEIRTNARRGDECDCASTSGPSARDRGTSAFATSPAV